MPSKQIIPGLFFPTFAAFILINFKAASVASVPADNRNAFSVYSLQKRADAEILPPLPTWSAYKTSNAVYFAHGRYYVELVGSTESVELVKTAVEVTKKFTSVIVVDDTAMAELDLFPQKNMVPGSLKLHLTNAFGFDGLTDTFTARHKFDNEIVTAFFSKRHSPQDAQRLLESYYKFLIDNGAKDKKDFNFEFGRAVTFYGTFELIFKNDVYIAGVHEADSLTAAVKAATMLKNKLTEAAGK